MKSTLLVMATFFVVGSFTLYSFRFFEYLQEGFVLNAGLPLYLPGLTFGILLTFSMNSEAKLKWKSKWLPMLISIIANVISGIAVVQLVWSRLWHVPTIFETVFTVGIVGGAIAGSIISFIPNTLFTTGRLTIYHFLTPLIGGIFGQIVLTLPDWNHISTTFGFGFWFVIIGQLTIQNIKKLSHFRMEAANL